MKCCPWETPIKIIKSDLPFTLTPVSGKNYEIYMVLID